MNETYQSNDNSRTSAMMTGFLLGSIVGAGIALLFAPATGQETRRVLRERARRLGSDAQDVVNRTREGFEGVKKDAKSAFDAGREAYTRSRQTNAPSDAVSSEVARS